jgi:hypothetical protein
VDDAELKRQLDAAEIALTSYSGCSEDRAEAIVKAVHDVAITAALGTISGEEIVATSVTDQRVARLRGLTDIVGTLVVDEIAGVFRITLSQARALDRTFQARFPKAVEDGLNKRLAAMVPTEDRLGTKAAWCLNFTTEGLRRHAIARFRRRGIEQDVVSDKDSLELRFLKKGNTASATAYDSLEVLGIPKPPARS